MDWLAYLHGARGGVGWLRWWQLVFFFLFLSARWIREGLYVVDENQSRVGDELDSNTVNIHCLGGLRWLVYIVMETLGNWLAYICENRGSEARKSGKGGDKESHFELVDWC